MVCLRPIFNSDVSWFWDLRYKIDAQVGGVHSRRESHNWGITQQNRHYFCSSYVMPYLSTGLSGFVVLFIDHIRCCLSMCFVALNYCWNIRRRCSSTEHVRTGCVKDIFNIEYTLLALGQERDVGPSFDLSLSVHHVTFKGASSKWRSAVWSLPDQAAEGLIGV